MTKSDFVDWKRHPVTQQVFSNLQARIEMLKQELVGLAASGDTHTLAVKAGAILAHEDLLSIDFEETQ